MEENFEGVNESEAAEQTEEVSDEVTEVTEGEPEGNTEGTESETEPELDRNAIYADARRKAEAEARRKYSSIDAQYAERFKGFTNPETGQPITSAKDYFEALDAQERLANKKALAEKGLDPDLIEKAVNNSPMVRAANQVLLTQKVKELQTYLEKQAEEISKIDPDIKSVADIERSERYPEIKAYVTRNNLSVVDAYKLVYADKLTANKTAAVKQQAINNAKSQSHLKATDGGSATSDGLVEIPAKELDKWREFFPHKSAKELREAYNRSLHRN